MSIFQLASRQIIFTKMLPIDRKSSSHTIAIKSCQVPFPFQCRASYEILKNSQNILRRSANFQPSIWDYNYIQSLNSEYKEKSYKEESKVLKEEVRMILCKVKNDVEQLELIDILQRLGIAYHFNNEIRNILDNIYNMDSFMRKKSLQATALEFRLLRQHGYEISADIFKSFFDEIGNFKKYEYVDIKGMLTLYEASFLSFEDETILDEARDFTSKFLKEYMKKNGHDHYISLLIDHALELPLHWRVPRIEAKWFIKVYEKSCNVRSSLLQFAKLDFNIVQAIHQEELKHASSWWKSIGFVEKLSFSRDRLMENFAWSVAMYYDQDYANFRSAITKAICFVTAIDDIYDVYGTLEELELFTAVIDRWDQSYAMDNLPDFMKVCFIELNNFVKETASEILRKSGFDITPNLKKAWADLCKSYFIEAKWYYKGYTPSLGQYMENGWISISAPVILMHASFKREDQVFLLEEYSNIVHFCGILFRLSNDLGTSQREIEMGDVPKSIQCYMNETRISKTDAREHIKHMMHKTWKMINKEVQNSPLSRDFIEIAFNLPRTALHFYEHGDGYSIQDFEIQRSILSLIAQSIQ